MPNITEHLEFYEYIGSSGIPVRFPKVDPPEGQSIGLKPSEILASIQASDPEAATIVQYLPDEVGLAGLKDQIIEADKFDAIEKAVPTWPAKVRVQWHNGQTIKSNSPLYQAIIATGITADELRTMMVEAEKLESADG
jgi:hypothetical protein